MEPKQGVKKETRRHYQGYFQDGEYHVEKFPGTEVYEYDSKGYFTLYQSENYDENGDVSCGIVAVRRCENGAFIFETYNLNGEHLGYDKYDVVTANILADIIIPLLAVIAKHMKLGGIIITSGIINMKEQAVKDAFDRLPEFEILETTYQGEWVSFTAKRVK